MAEPHASQSLGWQGEEGGNTPLLDAFAAIALSLLEADTDDALRAALDRASHIFLSSVAMRAVICEIALSPGGRPLVLWQSAQGGLMVEEGPAFLAWFADAAQSKPGFVTTRATLRGLLSDEAIGRETGTRMAVLLEAAEPEAVHLARAITDAGAAAASRIRTLKAQALGRRHAGEALETTRTWLDLGADIAWEASDDAILHCRHVPGRRNDVASALEGMKLGALRVGASGHSLLHRLEERSRIRHMRVQPGDALARALRPGEVLYVSAARGRHGDKSRWLGTFSIVPAETGKSAASETASMLLQVKDSRLREERQRREAEAMLQGLRLLLARHASGERLAELVALIADCLGGGEACVIERGLDGTPRYLVPARREVTRAADDALAFLSSCVGQGATHLFSGSDDDGARLLRAFALEGRHLAVLSLPLQGGSAYLLCASRRDGFAPADLDFADRFTLLLRQALLLREEQAQVAQTAKMAALGQMSASIAHELRQPLNTISLAVQNLEFILSAPQFDADAIAAKVARILAQVDRASDVIDRMRRFGRKSAGDIEPVDLGDLIDGVEAIMNHVLLRAGVRLEREIAQGLTVQADRLQLEQVIVNLLQNAADAISGMGTPRERGEALVRIVAMPASEEEGMAIIRVEDSGPGFRPEILDRVLEPFFTTKSAEQGTGLGLAICDTILRESGGRIEPGNHAHGGYVAVYLPR